jgi:DNA-binding winged helix-turn-helix (wHTH) protein
MSSLTNHFYSFGDFTVDSSQRVLLLDGKPVALTPKAFDTLLILLEGGGRIVEKEDLKRRLWPNTFVEEANITFNIQQLRKALGDDARNPRFVETVARRGYRFIAPVEVRTVEEDRPADDSHQQASQPLSSTAEQTSAAGQATRAKGKLLKFGLIGLAVLIVAGVIIWKVLTPNVSEQAGAATEATTKAKVKLEQLTVTGQSYHVAISPDGKYVAYERVFETKGGIWVRQLAANTNVELVPPSGNIYGLAFNRTGDYVYFVRGLPSALYRVSLVGGPPTKIVDNLEGNFSLSRDNNQIVFVRQTINRDGQRQYSLMTANSDGTGEREWLTGAHPYGLDTPMWAPDSRSIICSYGSTTGGSQDVSIIEVSLADGQKKELSSKKFFRITKMAWLANGSGLLLSARTNLGENNQLWKLSYPSMELTQLTEGVVSYADLSLTADAAKGVASQETLTSDIWVGSSREPNTLKRVTQASGNFCWAPDGRLVYSSTASGNRDLWIMQRDGKDQRQLTVDAAMDVSPRVTSDNRHIVFISNRTGEFQVWRMNIDGTNQTQLTNGGPKNHISISPDNKWIFYNTTDDWHLWRISIDGGEPVKLAQYVATLASMSPDQDTIICVGREATRSVLMILPATGGAPVRRIDLPSGRFGGYRIKWTPDGKSVIYMAQLDGPIMIYKQPLDGGPPQEIAKFDQDELFDFDYSADGQFFAVTRGGWFHDVVLISDLNQ